ncbi:Transposase Tan1 [Venturia nashicola]|uniref:Transposase Tan1 n=1 Tax=Venturia nashicola TaxID=86259 RepID=A0A4Z1P6W1_9PEZI|nr:Transposase Tan1 [Venturia nashicola]
MFGLFARPSETVHTPFDFDRNSYKAQKQWPPDFSKISERHQFRMEKRYRRRCKLAYARPQWVKYTKLTQYVVVAYGIFYYDWGAEGAEGAREPPFQGARTWYKNIADNLWSHSSSQSGRDQLLDVGCCAVLKRSYGRLVEKKMGLGINHINKQEFLLLYQQARAEALHERNVRSGFTATGLVPNVLSLLHAQIHTPSPQLHPQPEAVWVAETPHNITKLQHQTDLLKQYLKRRTQSPPSPTDQASNQPVKGFQIAMHSAVLLASENEKLRTESQRQKRKKAKSIRI